MLSLQTLSFEETHQKCFSAKLCVCYLLFVNVLYTTQKNSFVE